MTYFTPIINKFVDLRENLGYKKQTYYQLNNFDKFISNNYPNSTSLTENIVLEWSQKHEKESTSGHRIRVGKIRLLAKYMISLGLDAYVLPTKYSSRKTNFIPYILTDEQLSFLFQSADKLKPSKNDPFISEILSVMLKLMYCCGLRPGECRLLKFDDVDLEEGILLIRENKQHKERYVPMADTVLIMCRLYAIKIRSYMPNSEYFFPSPNRAPYTDVWLSQIFSRLCKDAFPNSLFNVTPYSLRHRFATAVLMKWVNEGVDINAKLPYLSIYMGHSSIISTAYYIHLLPENLIRSSAINWSYFNSLIPEVD